MVKWWLTVIAIAVLDVLLIAIGFYMLLPKCGAFNG